MGQDGWTIEVEAGIHDRRCCPVWLAAPDSLSPGDHLVARNERQALPVQCLAWEEKTFLCFIVPFLGKGGSLRLQLKREEENVFPDRMKALEEGDRVVSVMDGEEVFFTYHGEGERARPYFHPMHAPGGLAVTRGLDPDEVGDHVHHRSLWVSHGDVNGTNNWSDEEGHGRTLCEDVEGCFSGPWVAGFQTRSRWVTSEGADLLEERLAVRALGGTEPLRLLDVDLSLKPLKEDVVFGDTKEGGLLSVRVKPCVEVRERRGGQITNAHGGKNESETWGRRSPWCHYGGFVEGVRAGIGIMDHPFNPHHPTYWHVRDYGLMTANPFGVSHYLEGQNRTGEWTLKAGETAQFRYRVIVHTGSHHDVLVRDRYFDWTAPPTARLSAGTV